jgi:hypothetical protein
MLESQLASKSFEATIRKASCEKYLLDPNPAGRWVEVYYFASETSTKLDRYARLKVEGGTFYIEHGIPDSGQILYTNPICENVTEFSFSGSGRCLRMQMTLSDNDQDVNFICSAVPQNQ